MTNRYKAHQDLIKRFKLLVTKEIPELKVFDRHVGMFISQNGRPVKINIKGMADMTGVYSFERKMPYHGTLTLPLSCEFEFKTGKAKLTKEQKNWQEFCNIRGILYFLVRDEKKAIIDIKNRIYKIFDFLYHT